MPTRKLSAGDEQKREHALRLLARMIADAVRAEQRQAAERQEARPATAEGPPAPGDIGEREEEG
jgi:hypothetical protein